LKRCVRSFPYSLGFFSSKDVTKKFLEFKEQRHNTENSKQIFPGKELRGYSPSSYIHVSVSDLYIPLIGLPILLQENRSEPNVGI
jgi:hypothetical protein